MEFSQNLQELRHRKSLTQEELAAALFVSRTAVSKWESGRGYPGIDSLKLIAEYFNVTVDELLSGKELLCVAQTESRAKSRHLIDLTFGLLDCSMLLLLFIPLFTQREGTFIRQVPLIALSNYKMWYVTTMYFIIILLSAGWGVATLALQNCTASFWQRCKSGVSAALSILAVLFFMATLEPYAASLVFVLFIIKGILLLKCS
ncbi:MAG: helix-turn-helix transcriptional regulator [Oscillospiraceae bacterium]|nr:helix-turn-helix transcriptional regulator [Oscillospiraceae bacterium]